MLIFLAPVMSTSTTCHVIFILRFAESGRDLSDEPSSALTLTSILEIAEDIKYILM